MQQFVDISAYNSIDWIAYRAWSSMVALKSSEGVGFTDPTFVTHRSGALAAGIERVLYYHFARPDLGNDPVTEANYQYQVVGAIRPQDMIVLDFEVEDVRATAEWAYQFLAQQQRNYGGRLPAIYASDAYIRARLQDSRLAAFPLWLARWTYDPTARPACPPPWTAYVGLQYSDRATSIPGIPGMVDADIYVGGDTMTIPQGWKDDGTTLTAPNGHKVVAGFRAYILNNTWSASNVPLEEEHSVSGVPGTRQIFAESALVWTPQNGVQVAALGAWYMAALQPPANVAQATQALGTAMAAIQAALNALGSH